MDQEERSIASSTCQPSLSQWLDDLQWVPPAARPVCWCAPANFELLPLWFLLWGQPGGSNRTCSVRQGTGRPSPCRCRSPCHGGARHVLSRKPMTDVTLVAPGYPADTFGAHCAMLAGRCPMLHRLLSGRGGGGVEGSGAGAATSATFGAPASPLPLSPAPILDAGGMGTSHGFRVEPVCAAPSCPPFVVVAVGSGGGGDGGGDDCCGRWWCVRWLCTPPPPRGAPPCVDPCDPSALSRLSAVAVVCFPHLSRRPPGRPSGGCSGERHTRHAALCAGVPVHGPARATPAAAAQVGGAAWSGLEWVAPLLKAGTGTGDGDGDGDVTVM